MAERYTVGQTGGYYNSPCVMRDGKAYCECSEADVADIAASLNAAEELAEALRPFAAMFEKINTTTPDNYGLWVVGEWLPTVGDVRRAAEALAKWGQSNV